MKKINLNSRRMPAVAVLFCVMVFVCTLSKTAAAQEHDGEEINVHNNTGHEVIVFLFMDDQVHLNESGGVQFASLRSGESAVVHVPNCVFSILLVDNDDIWHGEYHDCHNTDITFTPETGHTKKSGQ